jgi:hypothetical protein
LVQPAGGRAATTTGRWAAWTAPDRGGGPHSASGGGVVAAPEAFLRIGHALIGLICAIAGGRLGRRLFDRHHRGDAAVKAAGLALKVLEAGL